MTPSLAVSLLLSGIIGMTLGIFGGGGAILTVPVLVYITGIAPGPAVGMSLAIVGTTSLVAAYAHRQSGHVRVRVALRFGGTGVITAYLAARLSHLVPPRALMLSFALLMMVVAGWMLLGKRISGTKPRATTPPRPRHALVAGAVVGVVTGFLGVGGGFLIVPALIAFTGLEMRAAVGTSLLIIAINSAAGFVGHLSEGRLDLPLVSMLTAVAVAGALLGERLARRVSAEKLRGGFAVFVLCVGVAVAASSALGYGLR